MSYIVNILWYEIDSAKSGQRGGSSLQPLGISEYPCEISGINYVTGFSKSGLYGHTTVFILVCHLTKMARSLCSMPRWNHYRRVIKVIYK